MSHRFPNHPENFSHTIERIAHSHRFKVFGAQALATCLALTLPYSYSVIKNRIEDADANPTVKTILEAPPGQESAGGITYNLSGIDTVSADVATRSLGPVFQQLSPDAMESVNYNDASIDTTKLTNLIKEDFTAKGEDEISFVFNSASGINGTDIVANVIKDTDVRVKNVIYYETPDGVEGLLPGTKKTLTTLQSFISAIPGAEDSDWVRDGITVGTEASQFTDPNKSIYENVLSFFNTVENANRQTREKERPRVELIYDYSWIIANANLENSLKQIGDMRESKPMPTFIYMRSTNNPVLVDTEKSSKNTCEYARKALLSCFVVDVVSNVQIHTSYNFDVDANMRAIAANKDVIDASNERNYSSFKAKTSNGDVTDNLPVNSSNEVKMY